MIELEDDQLIELPSRRTFFFLLGSMFTVAAIDPGQLIAPAKLSSTQGMISADGTIQFMTLEEMNQTLKEIYLPLIREQMNSSPAIMAHFRGRQG